MAQSLAPGGILKNAPTQSCILQICTRLANEATMKTLTGLIRDYLPKGTDFRKLSEADIMFIENSLNNRPRKRLGYLSPLEMFNLVR